MGVDLLVIRKNEAADSGTFEDQSGLRLMAACGANLTELAEKLGVRPLDDFFDSAGAEFQFYEEWHGEEPPEGWLEANRQWFAPDEAIKTLHFFIRFFKESGLPEIVPKVESLAGMEGAQDGWSAEFYLQPERSTPPVKVEDMLNDLEECLKMLQTIADENDLFCFEIFA